MDKNLPCGRLVHLQVEGDLNGAEMMPLSGGIPGRRQHLVERKVLLVVLRKKVPVPGRRAISGDTAFVARVLHRRERIAEPAEKRGARHLAELRFGVVQIVDVDAGDAEIAAAAVDLVREEPRRQRVAAGDDVLGIEEPGPHEGLEQVAPHVVGSRAVEGQISALAAEDDLVAADAALAESDADGALAALIAVVDRGVDDVDAEVQRFSHRGRVQRVGRGVIATQVGADPQGGQLQSVEGLAKMPGSCACSWRRRTPSCRS